MSLVAERDLEHRNGQGKGKDVPAAMENQPAAGLLNTSDGTALGFLSVGTVYHYIRGMK